MSSRLLAELLAVVVPPACVVCRAGLPRAGLWLCAACLRALRPAVAPPRLPGRGCGVHAGVGAARP